MHPNDPVLFHQLQAIQRIIQDETWLEGERRRCPVSPHDRVVRENVCRVILRIGKEMRDSATAAWMAEVNTALTGIERHQENQSFEASRSQAA